MEPFEPLEASKWHATGSGLERLWNASSTKEFPCFWVNLLVKELSCRPTSTNSDVFNQASGSLFYGSCTAMIVKISFGKTRINALFCFANGLYLYECRFGSQRSNANTRHGGTRTT